MPRKKGKGNSRHPSPDSSQPKGGGEPESLDDQIHRLGIQGGLSGPGEESINFCGIEPFFDIIFPLVVLRFDPTLVIQGIQEKIQKNGGSETDQEFWTGLIVGFSTTWEEKKKELGSGSFPNSLEEIPNPQEELNPSQSFSDDS